MDTTVLIVIIAAVVVLAIGIAIALAVRSSRRKQLQSRFGPEYDRTVDHKGKRKATKDLRERAETRDRLHLRDLSPAERDRYKDEWHALQASFVDRPASALSDADRLVSAVMRDRGYPVDDFEQQADLVSVDHPQVVQHYRAAHRIFERSSTEDIDTEDQRRALVHYRALFDELMVPSGDGRDDRHDTRHDDRDRDIDLRDRRDDEVVDARDVRQADRIR